MTLSRILAPDSPAGGPHRTNDARRGPAILDRKREAINSAQMSIRCAVLPGALLPKSASLAAVDYRAV